MMKRLVNATGFALLLAATVMGCSKSASSTADTGAANAASLSDSSKMIAQYLQTFDTLDYDVFTHQKWDRLKESHAQDITVTFPDGRETHGLEQHIKDLKAMFVPMPDLAITEHPIKIGNGSWTAVVGRMTGTFTKPMPTPDGKMIPPTGKKVSLQMATVGHWTSAGVMDHEWLFWDNHAFMQQLGLVK
jgi:predicted ester cyclase